MKSTGVMGLSLAAAVSFTVAPKLQGDPVSLLNADTFKAATSATTALDWNVSDYWDNGIPNDASTFAKIQGSGTASGVYAYIRSGVPITVRKIGYSGNPNAFQRSVFVSDNVLTLGRGETSAGMHIYAPVAIPSGTMPGTRWMQFCGPISFADGTRLVGDYGNTYFRFDRWADGSVADRTNPYGENGALALTGATFAFYAPESSATNVVGTYSLTEGSPYIVRASGSRHAIAVGTTVSGACVAADTYVKRVFPDNTIELSAPATGTSGSSTLTFAAFTPSVRQSFAMIRQNSGEVMTMQFNKYRAEDGLVVSTTNFSFNVNGRVNIDTGSGFEPGLFATTPFASSPKDPSKTWTVRLARCELQLNPFPGTTDVTDYAQYEQTSAQAVSGIAVAQDMTFRIGRFGTLAGTIFKRGAGTLFIGCESAVTGRLSAQEGTLAVADAETDDPVSVSTIDIAAGATFSVPAQGLRVTGTFSAAKGSRIDGTGTLYLPSTIDLTSISLGAGVTVAFEKRTSLITEVGNESEQFVRDSNPVFWVDASNADSLTTETSGNTTLVTRIDDVRGSGYRYATAGSNKPELRTDGNVSKKVIYFSGIRSSSDKSFAGSDDLAWSEPVFNMRTIFQVCSQWGNGNSSDKFCNFLGTTNTLTDVGGVNHVSELTKYYGNYNREFFNWAPASVKQGSMQVDGSTWNYTKGYPYYSYNEANVGNRYANVVISLVTDGTQTKQPAANCFYYEPKYPDRDGGHKVLCELIVYDREVSLQERMQITAYLMKKWKNCTLSYGGMQTDGGTLGSFALNGTSGAVAACDGSTNLVESVSGSGTFATAGAGTVRVNGMSASGISLDVRGGTLEVMANRAADDSLVPEGAVHWFDAAKEDSVTYTTGEGGVKKVSAWADHRGGGYGSATLASDNTINPPKLVAKDALGGKPVVDFGQVQRWNSGSQSGWLDSAPCMQFSEVGALRTVIAVWGSEHGGGNLAGSWHNSYYWHMAYELPRAGATSGSSLIGADATAAVIRKSGMSSKLMLQCKDGSRFHLNGERCDATETGLSGGFDIATFVGYETFRTDGFSGVNVGTQWAGGEQFGEYMLFQRGLSQREVENVTAYLRKKWFGVDTPGYGDLVLDKITVSSGATLTLNGGTTFTAGGLGGGGTVSASVILTENAEMDAVVNQDGTVSGLTVTGDLDLSNGGVVRFTGAVPGLVEGDYLLVRSEGVLSVGEWVIDTTGVPRRFQCALRVRSNELRLLVMKRGIRVRVR